MKTVYFDIESTGADASKDRIIQLAIKLIDDNGKIIFNKAKLYKPEIPISQAATDTHGLTDEMVEDYPAFSEDAEKLKRIFEDSILIGYNIIKFDIPMLLAEFDRCGINLELSGHVIDIMKLETELNPRTLGAVYKRYTGLDIENAHSADADVNATEIIFEHQLKAIKKAKFDKEVLLKKAGLPEDGADFFGKLKYDEKGQLVWNFGKHVGLRVLLNEDTKKYATWVIGENFPGQVKRLLQDELKKDVKKQFKRSTKAELMASVTKPQGFHPITQKVIKEHISTGEPLESIAIRSANQANMFTESSDDLPF